MGLGGLALGGSLAPPGPSPELEGREGLFPMSTNPITPKVGQKVRVRAPRVWGLEEERKLLVRVRQVLRPCPDIWG